MRRSANLGSYFGFGVGRSPLLWKIRKIQHQDAPRRRIFLPKSHGTTSHGSWVHWHHWSVVIIYTCDVWFATENAQHLWDFGFWAINLDPYLSTPPCTDCHVGASTARPGSLAANPLMALNRHRWPTQNELRKSVPPSHPRYKVKLPTHSESSLDMFWLGERTNCIKLPQPKPCPPQQVRQLREGFGGANLQVRQPGHQRWGRLDDAGWF